MARKPAPRSKASSTEDVALICGVGANGSDLHVLRRRNNRIETGIARALREGQPIQGELVRLRPREQFPLLCDVEVELEVANGRTNQDAKAEPNAVRVGPTHGPAQVSNDSYRKNWDAIWKRPSTGKKMVN
jgi:hypothetical protein